MNALRPALVECHVCSKDDFDSEKHVCEACGGEGKFRANVIRMLPRKKEDRPKGYRIRRTAADDKFSKFIRQRDNYSCTRCGKTYASNSSGLHAMHCFTRSRKGLRPGFLKHTGMNCCLRHDPRNALAGCWKPCHEYLDDHHDEKLEHFRGMFGTKAFAELEELAATTTKTVARRTA